MTDSGGNPAPAEGAAPPSRPTSATLSPRDRLDHLGARLGWRREHHRAAPGLWRLGSPGPDSPVLVTANYTLSFDALRSALPGTDAWVLVLDTRGINVWCAAGKGTFGTAELVGRIASSGLAGWIRHRILILPQLAAPGVDAREVRRATGFQAVFGPIRARDLSAFLQTGEATPQMRRVTFTLGERMILTPVEVVHASPYIAAAALLLGYLAGWMAAGAVLAAFLGGLLLVPALLPWLPGRELTPKGLLVGFLLAVPFAAAIPGGSWSPAWLGWVAALVPLLAMPPVAGYWALNFTGSTTFTSRTGVKREIVRWVPPMAWSLGAGLALGVLVLAFDA